MGGRSVDGEKGRATDVVSIGGEGAAPKTQARHSGELWEWVKALLIGLLLALFVRTFLFQPTIVEGDSMAETLKPHERVLVNRFIYHFSPIQRGDIVVFHAMGGKELIKRVIGLPGDRIEMRHDVLYVNGQPVEEPYLKENLRIWAEKEKLLGFQSPRPFTEDFSEVQVPAGKIFVLGDNRPASSDSRFFGFVSMSDVVGKADLVYWPMDRIRLLGGS